MIFGLFAMVSRAESATDAATASSLSTSRWLVLVVAAAVVVVTILLSLRKRRTGGREVLIGRARSAIAALAKPAARTPIPPLPAPPAPPAPPPGTAPEPPPVPLLTRDTVSRLDHRRLELLVLLYFKETGVRARGAGGEAHGGVNIDLYGGSENQPSGHVMSWACGSGTVDAELVHRLTDANEADGVREGMLFTTGDFAEEAHALAAERNITLIDGPDLLVRVNQLPLAARRRLLAAIA